MLRLLNGTTLDLLLSVRQDEIKHLMKSLSEKANAGEAVDLSVELMKLTNNVISRMLMSKRCSDKENEATDMRNLVTEINKTTETIIKEHQVARKQETGEVKDLLSILLEIADNESTEIKLSRENIKAIILNMFSAGTDTSALTTEWALAELINHPNSLRKAVDEIGQVVGKKRLLQESDLPNLPYLEAIVKETLRLHPAAPLIPRRSTNDCTVAGYYIPAKTNIYVNVWALGRDPNYWNNPLEFQPERFIESRLDVRGQHFHMLPFESRLDVRGQHFHMLPFGSGRRICPGTSLALQVVQATLGAMIQCFDWKAGKDGNLPRVDMEEGLSFTLSRANPLVCVPVTRLDPILLSI
uniref:Cytochrome P450 93A3-like n=1 Tax=Tanacetum cinerariifolium TaxID=118510 RepID=A0A699KQT9_TANCI|nr:cytochrome P450 93A3-like [Tanacetum cinerariifolium]